MAAGDLLDAGDLLGLDAGEALLLGLLGGLALALRLGLLRLALLALALVDELPTFCFLL